MSYPRYTPDTSNPGYSARSTQTPRTPGGGYTSIASHRTNSIHSTAYPPPPIQSSEKAVDHRLTATKDLALAGRLGNEATHTEVLGMMPTTDFVNFMDDYHTRCMLDRAVVPRDETDVPNGSRTAVRSAPMPVSSRVTIAEKALDVLAEIRVMQRRHEELGENDGYEATDDHMMFDEAANDDATLTAEINQKSEEQVEVAQQGAERAAEQAYKEY